MECHCLTPASVDRPYRANGRREEERPITALPFTSAARSSYPRLALAKELVDAHDGRLDWEPADPGARLVITLPRVI